jgi:hypothetical protein
MSPADQERARIRAVLDAVDETLRGAAAEHEPGYDEPEPARPWGSTPDILKPGSNAGMNKWRAEAEEFQRKREAHARQERRAMDERKARSDADWNNWADSKIAAALEAHAFNDRQRDILGMVIAEERKRERAELTKTLGEVVAELRQQLRDEIDAKVRELRTELRDDGKIVDLPKGSWRRSDAA